MKEKKRGKDEGRNEEWKEIDQNGQRNRTRLLPVEFFYTTNIFSVFKKTEHF